MKIIKEYGLITIGVLLVALSIEFFLAPNKIAAGGVTGIAIIINGYIPKLQIGLIVLILNVVLFIIGFIAIGNKFGAKTIYSSLMLSAIIWMIERTPAINITITTDQLLASVFGTFLSGIGMGIVFNQNASTGGTDILAKILNKFIHIDIGKSLLAVDFIVTLFAAVSFGAESGMYALLSVIINGFVIDTVIEGLNISRQIFVISPKNDLISKYIMEDLERGCTILHGKGGYSKEDTYILYTVLGRKEFIKLKGYIKEVDRKAFISITHAHEVLGEGFKDIIEDE